MNLKKIAPFDSYVLLSDLSVEEVKSRLANNIEPKKSFRFSDFGRNSVKEYRGELIGNTFTIRRNIKYRNSFLPVISVQISSKQGETQIGVKSRPDTFVVVFISIWLGMAGLFCLGTIIMGVIQFRSVINDGFSPLLLIPFGMLIFGYLLMAIAFKVENNISKKFLITLFEVKHYS